MKFNQKGFSLVQVLIASGLVAVVSLGVAQLMVDSARIAKANKNNIDQTMVYSSITKTISKEGACKTALAGNVFKDNPKLDQPVTLTMPDGTVYKSGQKIDNTDLKIKKLYLKKFSGPQPGPSTGTQIYLTELYTQLEATGANIIGGNLYSEQKVGAFYVTTNASNVIQECNSETSVAYLCDKMGGIHNASTNDCEIKPDPKEVCNVVGGTFKSGKCDLKVTSGSGTASCKKDGRVVAKHGETVTLSPSSYSCWYTKTTYQCFDGKLVKQYSKRYRRCSCFTGETMVRMHDGSLKRIDKVKVGDRVLGDNRMVNNVIDIEVPTLHNRKLYSFNDDKKYFVTPEHPFRSERGWVSIDPEMTKLEHPSADLVDTKALRVGDKIYLYSGEVVEIQKINSIEDNPDRPVYNLILDGNNTYYANDYLVHNKP
ncbi:MAG: Hint domain-containing protein [Bdellovibrionales bacterium]|nr:Hint domain-containing protein [Bdellovibrionales bacterium]